MSIPPSVHGWIFDEVNISLGVFKQIIIMYNNSKVVFFLNLIFTCNWAKEHDIQ